MKLSIAQRRAIEKIGRSRKRGARVPNDIAWNTARSLRRRGLIMFYSYPAKVMFTYQGERLWSELHPTSKYRIK